MEEAQKLMIEGGIVDENERKENNILNSIRRLLVKQGKGYQIDKAFYLVMTDDFGIESEMYYRIMKKLEDENVIRRNGDHYEVM